MAASTASTSLTAHDQGVINRARQIEALTPTTAVLREFTGEDDIAAAAYAAFVRAQNQIGDLLNLVDRLTGQ